MEDKTHIIPTGLEYDRVLWGLERYGVSKIILLRSHSEMELEVDPFVERLKQHYSHLVETNMLQEVYLDNSNLGEIFGTCKSLIETESSLGQVYINISTSTKLMAVGLVMSTWCSDLSRMKALPVIYYASPESYANTGILGYASKIEKVLAQFESALKKKPEEVFALLQEVTNFLVTFRDHGSGIGRGNMVMVPFMPISLPSEFEMSVLATLETFGGEVARIDDIVKALAPGKSGKPVRENEVAIRSKVSYHLRNLENRQLIEKVPSGIGTRVRITPLGKVFVRPRMLRAKKLD